MASSEVSSVLRNAVIAELRPVTYKWLARQAGCSADEAKRTMAQFVKEEKEVESLWVVGGEDGEGGLRMRLVPASEVEAVQRSLRSVATAHVYSVQPQGAGKDCGSDVWQEEFAQSLDLDADVTGVNALRDNRTSAVQCDEIVWNPDAVRRKRNAKGWTSNPPPSGGNNKNKGKGTAAAVSGLAATGKVSTARAAAAAASGKETAVKAPQAVAKEVKRADAGSKKAKMKKPVKKETAVKKEEEAPPAVTTKEAKAGAGPPPSTKQAKKKPVKKENGGKERLASMFAKAPPPKPVIKVTEEVVTEPVDDTDDSDEEMVPASRRRGHEKRTLMDDLSEDEWEAKPQAPVLDETTDIQCVSEPERDEAMKDASDAEEEAGEAADEVEEGKECQEHVLKEEEVHLRKEEGPKGMKRRRVEKTTMNERGEEITEMVSEEYEDDSPSKDGNVSSDENVKPAKQSNEAKKESKPKPATKSKPKDKDTSKSKGAAKGQRGIMSFFKST